MKSIVLGLALSTVTLAFGDYKAEEANGYTWVYDINESTGEADIKGLTTRPSGTLKFPSSLGGAPVKNLQFWSFDLRWELQTYDWDEDGEYSYWTPDYETRNDWLFDVTKVVIPSSVLNISVGCFSYQEPWTWTDEEGNEYTSEERGWKNLKSVSLPDSIVRCDAQAFYGTPFYYGKTFGELILSSSGKTLYGIKEVRSENEEVFWMPEDIRIPATVTRLADGSATSWQFSFGRMIFEGARPSATDAAFLEIYNTCGDSSCETIVPVTNQNVQVVYYADPNAKGWKWGGSWCGVKTYSLDAVPPDQRTSSPLKLGPDPYVFNQWEGRRTWFTKPFEERGLCIDFTATLYTGDDVASYASEDGRWFVIPVTGAKTASEVKPVIVYGSATSDQISGVSVWTDEQLRARAMPATSTKSKWRKSHDGGTTDTYEYEGVGSTCFCYEWPRDLWPNNKAVSGRYWVVVELNQRGALGSGKWSGDYTFRVGLKGTSEWSPLLHVVYCNPKTLKPSQVFRGVTLGGYDLAEFDSSGDEMDFVYSTGALTIALPEAGTLYLYGDTNDGREEHGEEVDRDCIDKKTLKITGANILSDKVVNPWEGGLESEEQWEQFIYQNPASIIRVVKVGGKTTLSLKGLLDVHYETDFQRIQFFPNSKKAVAVEVSFGDFVAASWSGGVDEDTYLQGKVSGTGVYKSGETVKLVATPGSGEAFDGWEVLSGSVPKGTDLKSKTLTFKVTDSIAGKPDQRKQIVVRAKWRPKYGVYGYPTVAGRATITGGGLYYAGKTATLTVKPASGCAFVGWTDGNTDNPRTVKAIEAPVDHVFYAIVEDLSQKKKEDKAALKFSSETKGFAKTPVSAKAGAKFSFALSFSALDDAEPKVTVSELPDGLSYSKTTGKVSGTVKKPGRYTAKVTVKTKLGNKISQKVKIDVTVPSGYYGTFDGYALVKTTPAYMTFTSDKYGAVSGKVTYKGKGYSFKASYSSVSATKSKFTPSIKIGSKTYKPAVTIEKTTGGITVSEARGEQKGKFIFVAQKKPGLVKTGKVLAGLIGGTVPVSNKKYADAKLPNSSDSLKLKFAATDAVKVTGKLKGKSVSFSTTVIYCAKKGDVYTAEVAFIEPKSGYSRLATFTLTVGKGGKVSKKVAFSKIKAEE